MIEPGGLLGVGLGLFLGTNALAVALSSGLGVSFFTSSSLMIGNPPSGFFGNLGA
jgi:hypothetical protein